MKITKEQVKRLWKVADTIQNEYVELLKLRNELNVDFDSEIAHLEDIQESLVMMAEELQKHAGKDFK